MEIGQNMETIRVLKKAEIGEFMRLVLNAYPRFAMPLEHEALGFKERVLEASDDPSIGHYGYFLKEELLGVMRCHELKMNMFGEKVKAGGVGLLGVDLLHKKEHVAMKMMEYFHRMFGEKGACITLLYPFSVPWYRRMGYGYAAKIHQYRINPLGLPGGDNKKDLCYLKEKDRGFVAECYSRFCDKTHGMCERAAYESNELFNNPHNIIIGCKKREKITGYMVFHFARGIGRTVQVDNRYKNDIYVEELVYENQEALSQLMTFLYSQADQINRVVIQTQDEHFHHMLSDVSNGSDNVINPLYHESNVSGVGLMYRFIDVHKAFELLNKHNFSDQNLTMKLTIRDSFIPLNDGSAYIRFEKGLPKWEQELAYDVAISIDISDFSSLLMGVVPFERLYRYGLALVSDTRYVRNIDALFRVDEKPVCFTGF
jgi:predicted acetyltransferase